MIDPITVIGCGLAGVNLVRELRKLDKDVPIRLITADDGHFYSKPMLSNGLATGKTAEALVMIPHTTLTTQTGAEILPRTRLQAIDPVQHRIRTDAGDFAYSRLVLALGATPIRLPIGGDGAADVVSINHLDDYAAYRRALEDKQRVALLGAGLIGCEFANDLRLGGRDVDVFDIAPQALGRLLPAGAAATFQRRMEAAGVRFHFGVGVERIERSGNGYRLTDSAGVTHAADLVVSAVGLKPDTTLAAAAGLQVQRGIVVDRQLLTSAPDIYAIGDCAEVAGLVLPFVMPIMQQTRALAQTLAGNTTAVDYPAMPVVVKTPTCPVVVSPPPAGAAGTWTEEATAEGLRALYQDTTGNLLGFALVGDTTGERMALAKTLPPLL